MLRRPPTTGHRWHSSWRDRRQRHSTCWWQTIDSLGLVTRSTDLLISFFVQSALVGVLLSWPKTAGGNTITWVSFELLHRNFFLGISQRRAEWFIRWCREDSAAGPRTHSCIRGRIGQDHVRCQRTGVREALLEAFVQVLVLAPAQIKPPGRTRFAEPPPQLCRNTFHSKPSPRVDAQASNSRTGVGGWLLVTDEEGKQSKWLSPWFSLRKTGLGCMRRRTNQG